MAIVQSRRMEMEHPATLAYNGHLISSDQQQNIALLLASTTISKYHSRTISAWVVCMIYYILGWQGKQLKGVYLDPNVRETGSFISFY